MASRRQSMFPIRKLIMFKQTAVTALCGIALFGAMLAIPAHADEWNRKTVVTFSAPVEIPGVHVAGWGVLPAGTYVFKILDSLSDRHIVQIFNKEETTIYATILAIPNYRLKATDKTVMTFAERAAGEPEALRAWFYPGRNWGEEFVYPKSKAIAIAKAANTPVLYTPIEVPVEIEKPTPALFDPIVSEFKRAPVMAIQPSGEDLKLAEVVTPPPAADMKAETESSPSSSAATLPATASEIPVLSLLGLMTLAGAWTARVIANHRA